MKKLPDIRCADVSVEHRDRLARWLREWEVDRALTAGDPPEPDGREPVLRVAQHVRGSGGLRPDESGMGRGLYERPRRSVGSIGTGDIRLLFPSTAAARRRPIYVAVLALRGGETLLVAPFSRFSEAASPGEWRMNRDMPCRVLCLWNARLLSKRFLSESWRVDRLSDDQVKHAGLILDSMDRGLPIPPELRSEVGLPVQHPLDPRLEYKEEESALMPGIRAGGLQGRAREPGMAGDDTADRSDGRRLLAAEPRATYGRRRIYSIPERSLYLWVSDRPDGSKRLLCMSDREQGPSPLLDGFCVVSGARRFGAPIADGRADVPRGLPSRDFQLRGPDGTVLQVTPVGDGR